MSAREPADALIAFLNARLEEDEQMGKATSPLEAAVTQMIGGWLLTTGMGERALREAEAKRVILALHQIRRIGTWPVCTHCRPVDPEYTDDLTSEPWPCRTLRALAAVYSDHPDYRQEWKP